MLKGKSISLRPIRDTDLEKLYAFHIDIANRGDFFPRSVVSQPVLIKRFQDTGLWTKDEGFLVIVDHSDAIIGRIEFHKTVDYLDEYEVSYILYALDRRGQGVMTEALGLMVRYLFETKPMNRIRLLIHPDNAASRRVAEKCAFRHEGTARGAWYNNGRHQDLEVYAILHDEVLRE